MNRRSLAGLEVSAVGLGCMGMSAYYGPPTDTRDAVATIRAAIDCGVTMVDTADVSFDNERLLGHALEGRRDDVVVATKFGSFTGAGGSPEAVRRACDASLARLGVDEIDLWYQFRVDPDVAVEETWGAMAECVAQGKVRRLGICEAAAATVRRAHAVHPVTAVQSEYSLWTRDPESNGVLEVTAELGIGFVASCPLGRMALTGALRSLDQLDPEDTRRRNPRFMGENLGVNLAAIEALRVVALEHGLSMPRLVLAWLLSRRPDLVVIPGTTSRRHLAENASAADVVLAGDLIARIEDVLPAGFARGNRYSDLSWVDG